MTKRMAVVATAAAALATAGLATAPAASAGDYNGCGWPRVCFYMTDSNWDNGNPTAAYQDVTDYYQNLGSKSRGANYVRNTRNDDRVRLRYYDKYGVTYYACLKPNQTFHFSSTSTVTGVKIQTQSACG
ncbi:hypothetical protein GCM10022384_46080 [Streptomyces marokkonensis]|uniref:Peptidase inhibitor family I36 n=2 Tax=Streptomyces marokkonensis TaxID=324855 RepID=A0ABP7R672_9ACTN